MADTWTEVLDKAGNLDGYERSFGPKGKETAGKGGRLFNEITQRIADNDPSLTILPPAAPPVIPWHPARAGAYAPVRDQLDMQYWDAVNGTTTWRDHVAAVKAAHPEPS